MQSLEEEDMTDKQREQQGKQPVSAEKWGLVAAQGMTAVLGAAQAATGGEWCHLTALFLCLSGAPRLVTAIRERDAGGMATAGLELLASGMFLAAYIIRLLR